MSKPKQERRYWLAVASRDHVKNGVAGGFCQMSHGKPGPLMRIRPGDGIVYYSPRTEMRGGDPVQGFTAIGVVAPGEPYAGSLPLEVKPGVRNPPHTRRVLPETNGRLACGIGATPCHRARGRRFRW